MFTITDMGVTGELPRCLATTNVIESPNSVVRRVSGRVNNYKDAEMVLRWTAAGFPDAKKSFKKLRGYANLNRFDSECTFRHVSQFFSVISAYRQLRRRHRCRRSSTQWAMGMR